MDRTELFKAVEQARLEAEAEAKAQAEAKALEESGKKEAYRFYSQRLAYLSETGNYPSDEILGIRRYSENWKSDALALVQSMLRNPLNGLEKQGNRYSFQGESNLTLREVENKVQQHLGDVPFAGSNWFTRIVRGELTKQPVTDANALDEKLLDQPDYSKMPALLGATFALQYAPKPRLEYISVDLYGVDASDA